MIAPIGTFNLQETSSTSSTFNGVRLSTRTMPAHGAARGGDWCEAFALSVDTVALSIGDVSGHGIETFQPMVAIRQALRNAAHRGLDPARTLLEARHLLGGAARDMYATAIFALLDSRTRTISLANAGHPSPIMASSRESCFLDFPTKDCPLGVGSDLLPAVRIVTVPEDTLLVFYTDGVTERERDSFRGEAALREAVLFAYQCPLLAAA